LINKLPKLARCPVYLAPAFGNHSLVIPPRGLCLAQWESYQYPADLVQGGNITHPIGDLSGAGELSDQYIERL
jgi:hypothetical protein